MVFLQTLAGFPDQDTFYDVVDSLEEQGMEPVAQRHINRKGTDLDLVEQFNIYEVSVCSVCFSIIIFFSPKLKSMKTCFEQKGILYK